MNEQEKFAFRLPIQNIHGDLPVVKSEEFGRVTVILGVNGSGKSRMLAPFGGFGKSRSPLITKPGDPVRNVVYIEGGRAIQLRFSPGGPSEPVVKEEGIFAAGSSLTSKVSSVLRILDQEDFNATETYKNHLYVWASDKSRPEPVRPESNLSKIFDAFHQIFPHLMLSRHPNRTLMCTRNGVSYSIDNMSDGEKQVFCMVGVVGFLAPENPLVVIDEPELNLHPSLATVLWDWIERHRMDAAFVYATHSVSFAMRQGVTDLVVLRNSPDEPIHLSAPFDFPTEELEPFLGSIPAIAVSRRLLVAEGTGSDPFDARFYRWLTDGTFTVRNVGNCYDVREAVRHSGVWKHAGDVEIIGVVDRDYRGEQYGLPGQCIVLPYHEAESCVCHPNLLVDASRLSGKNCDREAFVDLLTKLAKQKLVRVALTRLFELSKTRLGIGKGKDDPWPDSKESAIGEVRRWAENEHSDRAGDYAGMAEAKFIAEYDRCKNAIDSRDVETILQVFPSKNVMVAPLARVAGFSGEDAYLNSVYTNLKPGEYPWLSKLRKEIGIGS